MVSVTTIQWVSTGSAGPRHGDPLSGWAVDRFGAKWVRMTAHALRHRLQPVRARLVSQLAHPFRVLQDVGGGILLPVGQSIWPARPGPSAWAGHEHHRGPDGPGSDHGPGHRRSDGVRPELALDLLHQRAHRHRHADLVRGWLPKWDTDEPFASALPLGFCSLSPAWPPSSLPSEVGTTGSFTTLVRSASCSPGPADGVLLHALP